VRMRSGESSAIGVLLLENLLDSRSAAHEGVLVYYDVFRTKDSRGTFHDGIFQNRVRHEIFDCGRLAISCPERTNIYTPLASNEQ
jgi:hypothetical protein